MVPVLPGSRGRGRRHGAAERSRQGTQVHRQARGGDPEQGCGARSCKGGRTGAKAGPGSTPLRKDEEPGDEQPQRKARESKRSGTQGGRELETREEGLLAGLGASPQAEALRREEEVQTDRYTLSSRVSAGGQGKALVT